MPWWLAPALPGCHSHLGGFALLQRPGGAPHPQPLGRPGTPPPSPWGGPCPRPELEQLEEVRWSGQPGAWGAGQRPQLQPELGHHPQCHLGQRCGPGLRSITVIDREEPGTERQTHFPEATQRRGGRNWTPRLALSWFSGGGMETLLHRRREGALAAPARGPRAGGQQVWREGAGGCPAHLGSQEAW